MSLKNLIIFVFILSVRVLFSQPYASSNMTLISITDPEPGVSPSKYSGCWGWTQPETGREYAIAGSQNGTYWIDITNPATPTVAAYINGTSMNGIYREIKTYGNYCYVISDDWAATGFQVFDMSTLPATVTLVSSNEVLFKQGHASWIDDNKLYISSVTYSSGVVPSYNTMNVYSLANPATPVLLRSLDNDYPSINGVHDQFVKNDTVYASCGYQGLQVFKFNNGINTFTQLGALTSYAFSGYNHSSALTPNGQTLVFMDEVPSGLPIKAANVSNLGNITVSSTFSQFPQSTPHNPFMVNNKYCFVSSYQDGTQLWDISNPFSPFLAGFFDTHPESGGNNNTWIDDYNGQWGMFPYFPSGNIIALDRKNGLFVLQTNLYTIPEIQIMGNNVGINDGDVFASLTDNTFFGSTNAGSPVSNTFAIQNLGTGSLSVSSLSITGANSADFIFVGAPSSFTLAAGASQTITVQFTPLAANTRTAELTVYNSDLNESIFQFVIAGYGVGFPTSVSANSQNSISEFKLFPNPANSKITLNYQTVFSTAVNIKNELGQIIYEKKFNGDINENIDVKNFANGIYFISITVNNQTNTQKLIINH